MQLTFRDLLDCWDESADQMAKDQIKTLLDGGDFVLFFKKGKELFAAGESSRIVFANMKNPDDETPDGWAEEATLTAVSLDKALEGFSVKRIFYKKDIDDMKIIDQDDAYKELVKKADHNSKINLAKVMKDMPQDDEEEPIPANMDKLGEK